MIISELTLRSSIRKTIMSEMLNEANPSIDRMTGGGAESFGKAHKGFSEISDKDFINAVSDLSIEFAKGSVDASVIAALFLDPTGITAIPDIAPALQAYQKNKTLINLGLLILSVLAAAPVVGKLAKVGAKGLKSIKAALVVAKNAGKVPSGLKKVTDDAIEAIDKSAKSTGSKTATSATSKIARIPKYGETTTIGYHGTSKKALENIKKHGLDNRVGRETGEGLDSISQGLMAPTVSNWTYTPQKALGFAESYGDDAVLLRFDTASVTNQKGVKSNKTTDSFGFQTGKEAYFARPKNPNDEIFHKYELGSNSSSSHRGFQGANDQQVLSKLEFSKSKNFEDIVELNPSELSNNSRSLMGFRDSTSVKSVGSAEVPVPPELISVSYDGGKTFSPLVKQ